MNSSSDDDSSDSDFADQPDCYKRLCHIGEGTYGVVYKGINVKSKRVVAMKKIKFDDTTEGIPPSCLREMSILKMLKHKNIIKLLNLCVERDRIYLILEYMQCDLKQVMNDYYPRLPSKITKSLMWQLLQALSYCHLKRIMHRDLKPQNLLVNEFGILKVADFGLARSFSLPCRTYSHDVVTLWYRPPELLLGCEFYGASIDLWSAGCIFAEMICNEPLFCGDSEIGQLFKIFQILGTPNAVVWPEFPNLPDSSSEFPFWTSVKDLKLVVRGISNSEKELLQMLKHRLESRLREALTEKDNCGKDVASASWKQQVDEAAVCGVKVVGSEEEEELKFYNDLFKRLHCLYNDYDTICNYCDDSSDGFVWDYCLRTIMNDISRMGEILMERADLISLAMNGNDSLKWNTETPKMSCLRILEEKWSLLFWLTSNSDIVELRFVVMELLNPVLSMLQVSMSEIHHDDYLRNLLRNGLPKACLKMYEIFEKNMTRIYLKHMKDALLYVAYSILTCKSEFHQYVLIENDFENLLNVKSNASSCDQYMKHYNNLNDKMPLYTMKHIYVSNGIYMLMLLIRGIAVNTPAVNVGKDEMAICTAEIVEKIISFYKCLKYFSADGREDFFNHDPTVSYVDTLYATHCLLVNSMQLLSRGCNVKFPFLELLHDLRREATLQFQAYINSCSTIVNKYLQSLEEFDGLLNNGRIKGYHASLDLLYAEYERWKIKWQHKLPKKIWQAAIGQLISISMEFFCNTILKIGTLTSVMRKNLKNLVSPFISKCRKLFEVSD
ncbi:Cyclin-dependent kinase 2 [Trichinella nelsoni]|uniref:cyclin-dependent kinase n=1 Tax=Trichinella nelsoni TaxID=6336 RepID=A0A0V0S3P1_9BILA|nr:Cyclin-dependent kinase 2 [Trichinella nelsoni]